MSHQEKTKSVCPNERWQTTAFLFLYRKPSLCKNLISAESPPGGSGLGKSLCFTDLLWSSHNEERRIRRVRDISDGEWTSELAWESDFDVYLLFLSDADQWVCNEKHQLRSHGAQLFKSQSTAYIICLSAHCWRPISLSPGWFCLSEQANGFWFWWIEKVIVSREAELIVLWLSIRRHMPFLTCIWAWVAWYKSIWWLAVLDGNLQSQWKW